MTTTTSPSLLYLTAEEARTGCIKTYTLPNMTHPLTLDIKPGVRDGQLVTVGHVPFKEDGRTYTRTVTIRLHIITPASGGTSYTDPIPAADPAPAKRKKGCGCLAWVLILTLALCVGIALFDGDDTRDDDYLHGSTASDTYLDPHTNPYLGAYNDAAAVIPNFSKKLFLPTLSDRLLHTLTELYTAAEDYDASVEFSAYLTVEELDHVFDLMRAECPELLHVRSYSYRYQDEQALSLTFKYRLTKEEYLAQRTYCEGTIDVIRREVEGMTPDKVERHVAASITRRTLYDKDSENASTAYGVFYDGKAKCDGISKAFQWTMQELGYTCAYIAGSDILEPDTAGHGWNLLMLDGEPYILDLTAEISVYESTNDVSFAFVNIPSRWETDRYKIYDEYAFAGGVPTVSGTWDKHTLSRGAVLAAGDTAAAVESAAPYAEGFFDRGEVFCLQFHTAADFDAFYSDMQSFYDGMRDAYNASGRFRVVSFDAGNLVCFLPVED